MPAMLAWRETGVGGEKRKPRAGRAGSILVALRRVKALEVARPERFELPTFWFVARRSIQLS